jgi:periplasmic protein TonB
MKSILILLLILLSSLAFGQNKRDTIYYDKTWAVTKQIDSALYYRIIREENNLYHVTDYYIQSDSVQMTGTFKDYAQKIYEGEFVYYAKNGSITSKSTYKDGKLNGQRKSCDSTGRLTSTEDFVDGLNHGDFIVYYESGAISRKETYEHGKLIDKACYLENGKKTKYFPYETAASFPHGDRKGLIKYLSENLNYPKEAQKKGIEGKVYIQFVVSDKGEITNIKVKKGVNPLLDEEAVRVVKSMPRWNPGTFNGKPVNSVFSLPITFRLRR